MSLCSSGVPGNGRDPYTSVSQESGIKDVYHSAQSFALFIYFLKLDHSLATDDLEFTM